MWTYFLAALVLNALCVCAYAGDTSRINFDNRQVGFDDRSRRVHKLCLAPASQSGSAAGIGDWNKPQFPRHNLSANRTRLSVSRGYLCGRCHATPYWPTNWATRNRSCKLAPSISSQLNSISGNQCLQLIMTYPYAVD